MVYDVSKRHSLFNIAVKKSRGFKDPVSCFITSGKKIGITIDAYPRREDKPTVSITVWKNDGNDIKMTERYDLFADGSVGIFVSTLVQGIVGDVGSRRLTYEQTYDSKQILAGVLDEELYALANLLMDIETTKVNPCNISQILIDEEDEGFAPFDSTTVKKLGGAGALRLVK